MSVIPTITVPPTTTIANLLAQVSRTGPTNLVVEGVGERILAPADVIEQIQHFYRQQSLEPLRKIGNMLCLFGVFYMVAHVVISLVVPHLLPDKDCSHPKFHRVAYFVQGLVLPALVLKVGMDLVRTFNQVTRR